MKNQFEHFHDKPVIINLGAGDVRSMLLQIETETHLLGMGLPRNKLPNAFDMEMVSKDDILSVATDHIGIEEYFDYYKQIRGMCEVTRSMPGFNNLNEESNSYMALKRLAIAEKRLMFKPSAATSEKKSKITASAQITSKQNRHNVIAK